MSRRGSTPWWFHLAAGILVCLGGGAAWAQQPMQLPYPTPVEQLPRSPVPFDPPNASRVFPDDGFPARAPGVEGGIPKSPVRPGQVGVYPPGSPYPLPGPGYPDPLVQPAISDYPPPGGGYAREQQDTPGVPEFYYPLTGPLPAYFYEPSYYERPVVSPRSVIEYAPPGYEARDQQWTPGTPEFTPIIPPPPPAPGQPDSFVTRGIMPGSFLVPFTNTSFRLRGFVRLMALYDFNEIGSRDSFVPNTIPVPQRDDGENFNMSARMSRIAFESWTPTPMHEWTVHTFIEGDFFNGPAQAAGGGGNPFRLRHAFIDFGYFRVGQQNTVFMDATTWPSLVDFQGPAGWVNQRRPGARVTLPVTDKVFVAAGVEQPFSDITTPGENQNAQYYPDFAAHVRYETDFGHLQVAGLLRSIGYRRTEDDVVQQVGGGLSASTTFHPWAILIGSNPTRKANPTALERCRMIGQVTGGWGIARYVQDTVGLGLDGQVNPLTGDFALPFVASWVLSYEHWWTEQWLSNFTYSGTYVDNTAGQPGTTYQAANYVAASLWYNPIRNMSLGVEYLFGSRENLDGEWGRANRVNALVQYNF